LYAPAQYLRPTYAAFDLTVSFNAPLPSNRVNWSAVGELPRTLTISQGRESTISRDRFYRKYFQLNVSIYKQDMAELDEKPLKYNLAPLRAAVQFTGNIYNLDRL
jgi:hypothetical protein